MISLSSSSSPRRAQSNAVGGCSGVRHLAHVVAGSSGSASACCCCCWDAQSCVVSVAVATDAGGRPHVAQMSCMIARLSFVASLLQRSLENDYLLDVVGPSLCKCTLHFQYISENLDAIRTQLDLQIIASPSTLPVSYQSRRWVSCGFRWRAILRSKPLLCMAENELLWWG